MADLFAVISSLKAEVAELRAELAERDREVAEAYQHGDGYRAPRWAKTTELCRELNVKRTWAYTHRQELGAVKFGDGEHKPALRYDMEVARAFWASLSLTDSAQETKPSSRRRRTTKSSSAKSGKPVRAVPSYKFG